MGGEGERKAGSKKKSNTEEGKKEGGIKGWREEGGREEKEWLLLLTEAVMGVGQKKGRRMCGGGGERPGPEARDREREVERDPHDDCFCGVGGERQRGVNR